jgi:hypothetical protein
MIDLTLFVKETTDALFLHLGFPDKLMNQFLSEEQPPAHLKTLIEEF